MEGDARFCIENRFTLFARFCRLRNERAVTWSQPGLIAEVQSKHAQTSLRPPAEIQARIGKGDNVRSVGMMFHVKQKNPARAD